MNPTMMSLTSVMNIFPVFINFIKKARSLSKNCLIRKNKDLRKSRIGWKNSRTVEIILFIASSMDCIYTL